MTRIKIFFGKYKNEINIVVYFHIFQLLVAQSKKTYGQFYLLFKEGMGNGFGLYIDYMARLTSFILPLSLLLGRLKKGG